MGGSSYKDKGYLIKWPHGPSLLPKRRHSLHRVGVEQGESSRGAAGHLLRQHEGWLLLSGTPERFLQEGSIRHVGSPPWWGQKENLGISSDVSISFQKMY